MRFRLPPALLNDSWTDAPITAGIGLSAWFTFTAVAMASVSYDREVQPLFSEYCVKCHGPEKQKSSFRVDQRNDLLKGGESGTPAVVPGQIAKSHVLELLRSHDPDERMPPKGEPLNEEQIALLERWIAEGAVVTGQMEGGAKQKPDLWSFQPVKRPEVPAVSCASWSENPVDAFILDKLAKQKLQPNEPADLRTLLRRATLVLTGLPPTPAEVDDFLADTRPDAYERLVERLLASPHFGERWAQHWLDVIRWAESSGSEANYYRKNAWEYRDWVIDAFNRDKPYDHFIREQIAGDAFGQDAATGFLVAGPFVPGETVGQEPTAMKQARYDRLDEIVQTVSASMLGLTVGCARCHNHKFDPISAKDYYSTVAVFQDVEFDHRLPHLPESDPRAKAGRAILKEMAPLRDQLAALGPWEENWVDHKKVQFEPVVAKRIRLYAFINQVFLDEVEVYASRESTENLALGALGAVATSFRKEENPAKPPSNLIDGQRTEFWGWKAAREDGPGDIWVQVELPRETTIARLDYSNNRFPHYATDYIDGFVSRFPAFPFRIEVQTAAGEWKEVASSAALGAQEEEQKQQRTRLLDRLNALAKRYDAEGPQPIFAGRFIEPAATHVLNRGNPLDPREEVLPGGLEKIAGALGLSSESPGIQRRLAFANWLASPENPLTARVAVNHLWQHVFGTGIVSTSGDFGKVGALPTHPELLDWLASTFVRSGWSVKEILRRLVTSQTFRQASTPRADAIALDAGSQYLWRFPPRRLEAEVIRDAMLKTAGTLDETIGGQSYRIYNVKKRFQQWQVADNAGPQTWRRMLYQERMRGIDDRMFSAFDYPDCGQTRARRPVSTTPLQALNLLNGELIVKQSEAFAQRIARESGADPVSEVQEAFQLVLGRPATPAEQEATLGLLETDGLAALARTLFNTNEFAFLN